MHHDKRQVQAAQLPTSPKRAKSDAQGLWQLRKDFAMPALVHTTPGAVPRDRLLRLPQVEDAAGIKKSTVYALVREGKFPAPVRITRRLSVWPESAVLAWVQTQIRGGANHE